jgi:hypothetical protein
MTDKLLRQCKDKQCHTIFYQVYSMKGTSKITRSRIYIYPLDKATGDGLPLQNAGGKAGRMSYALRHVRFEIDPNNAINHSQK